MLKSYYRMISRSRAYLSVPVNHRCLLRALKQLIIPFLFPVGVLMVLSCTEEAPNSHLATDNHFTVDEHNVLRKGEVFTVRGVVYVPGYPGYLPWDIESATALPTQLEASVQQDIENIKAMGANTIRLWGAPRYCYEAIKETGDLAFIQTIWFDSEQPDFQNKTFITQCWQYIREERTPAQCKPSL